MVLMDQTFQALEKHFSGTLLSGLMHTSPAGYETFE